MRLSVMHRQAPPPYPPTSLLPTRHSRSLRLSLRIGTRHLFARNLLKSQESGLSFCLDRNPPGCCCPKIFASPRSRSPARSIPRSSRRAARPPHAIGHPGLLDPEPDRPPPGL